MGRSQAARRIKGRVKQPRVGHVRSDGKVFSGKNYGYQSKASYKKIKEQRIPLGTNAVKKLQSLAQQIEQARHNRFGSAAKDEKTLLGKFNKAFNNLYDKSALGVADEQAAELGGQIAKSIGVSPLLGSIAFGSIVPGPGEGRQVAKQLGNFKAPPVAGRPKRTRREGNSSNIATRENIPPNVVTNRPQRNALGDAPQPPAPQGYNPLTKKVEPRPLQAELGVNQRELKEYAAREGRRAARDPITTARAKASGKAGKASNARDFDRTNNVRTQQRVARAQRSGRLVNAPSDRELNASGYRSKAKEPKVPDDLKEEALSPLQRRRAQRSRQQDVRLRRAQQRIRSEAGVQRNNQRLTPKQREAMRRFNDQKVLDTGHPDGPQFRRHNADDTVREYNSGRGASDSDRAFAEGGDYQGDRYQDTGGFDARYDRDGTDNLNNPGFSVQSTDVTGAGTGRRGQTGALRQTFDIEKVKKDLKKAGIDPRKDRQAALKFIREKYPVQVYGSRSKNKYGEMVGETRSVSRPFETKGTKPGTVKTSSTLNEKVEKNILDRRNPQQFNQLRAERAEGAGRTIAERRDRGMRRQKDGSLKRVVETKTRTTGGRELPTPDRKPGGPNKTADERKLPGNIPGGERLRNNPSRKPVVGERTVRTSNGEAIYIPAVRDGVVDNPIARKVREQRASVRKSSDLDGSVDWKSGSTKRRQLQLRNRSSRYPANNQPDTRRVRAAKRQDQRRQSAEAQRRQFRLTKAVDQQDGGYKVEAAFEESVPRFNSGQARMESRRTGREFDKRKINSQVPRRTDARRGGFEATNKPTDRTQTGGKRGENVAYERENRTVAESVKPEVAAKSGLNRAQRQAIRDGSPGDRRVTSQHRRGGRVAPIGGAKPGAGGTKPARRKSARAIRPDERSAKLTPKQQQQMLDDKVKNDSTNAFYPSGRLRNTSETNYPRGGRKSDPTAGEKDFVATGRNTAKARKENRKVAETASRKPKLNKNGTVNKNDANAVSKAKAAVRKQKREMERIRKQRMQRRQR